MMRSMNSVSAAPLADPLPIRAVLAVSPRGFIAIWWLVQSVHAVFIVYSVNVIKLHRYFIIQDLQVTIDYMGPTVISFFDAVIGAHCVLIVCHATALLQSVWWSLYYRQWRFVRKSKVLQRRHVERRHTVIKQTLVSRKSISSGGRKANVKLAATPPNASVVKRLLQRTIKAAKQFGLAIFGRYGIFGVEGTYYESTFFAMEVVEIALQIFQAYKLSVLVHRVWINRLNVVILILNCWSTAFVHQFLHGNRLVKRVVLLVVDGIFDVISSMVIPLVIIYPYYKEFDLSRRDFPLVNYYSDVWVIQAISENRQIFVTSWVDYISKHTPGVTVFGGMLVLKQYVVMDRSSGHLSIRQLLALHARSGSGTRVRSTFMVALKGLLPKTHTQVEPFHAISPGKSTVNVLDTSDGKESSLLTRGERVAVTTALFGKYKNKWQHFLLFLTGLAVLIIHIHSTTVALLSHTRGCLLEVRPWFATSSTCVALEINCVSGQFDDGADEAALISHVHAIVPSALKSLVFASCARLHVPSVIQRFPGLQMIKIYNSTVLYWDSTAELREDLHSDLQFLYISDSNFSDKGEVPAGLLSDKFPPTLVDVEFSGTNLMNFPSNLHEKWTTMQFFVLERNPNLTEIPEPLVKMKIPQLYLGSNGITTIPDTLLVDQAFWALNFNGNPLQALPSSIGSLRSFKSISVVHTNISVLPPWLTGVQYDPVTGEEVLPFLGYIRLRAGGAPLCEDAGKKATATNAKLDWVRVNCTSSIALHVYPIEDERKWRADTQANLT